MPSNKRDDLVEVESSPDGRYLRFDERIGVGAYKEVWRGYDTETGKEIAWNTVDLRRLPSSERNRIRQETEILQELEHPHIINFFNVWNVTNEEEEKICFATEYVTSGTLKQYIHRVKGIKLKVIKKWCRQILNALAYLHAHDPPIIHRDLKCDNIFINGSTGEIRLGDFGLSSMRHKTHAESVLGTPEFMAPELYEENYSEKVDIYAFGMCIVEMATKEYPFEECKNAVQIWRKVSLGQKPEVYNRIREPQVKAFIELCLEQHELRPTAKELLNHPFLSFRRSDPLRENKLVQVDPRTLTSAEIEEQHRDFQYTRTTAIQSPQNNLLRNELREMSREEGNERRQRVRQFDPPRNRQLRVQKLSDTDDDIDSQFGSDDDGRWPAQLFRQSSIDRRPYLAPSPNKSTATQASSMPMAFDQQASFASASAATASQGSGRPAEYRLTAHVSPSSKVNNYPQPTVSQTASRLATNTGTGSLQQSQSRSKLSIDVLPQQPVSATRLPQNLSPNSLPRTQTAHYMDGVTAPSISAYHVTQIFVELTQLDDDRAYFVFHIHFDNGRKRQCKFEFDFEKDTFESVAREMVADLKLPDPEFTRPLIARRMADKLAPLLNRMFFAQQVTPQGLDIPSTDTTAQQQVIPKFAAEKSKHARIESFPSEEAMISSLWTPSLNQRRSLPAQAATGTGASVVANFSDVPVSNAMTNPSLAAALHHAAHLRSSTTTDLPQHAIASPPSRVVRQTSVGDNSSIRRRPDNSPTEDDARTHLNRPVGVHHSQIVRPVIDTRRHPNAFPEFNQQYPQYARTPSPSAQALDTQNTHTAPTSEPHNRLNVRVPNTLVASENKVSLEVSPQSPHAIHESVLSSGQPTSKEDTSNKTASVPSLLSLPPSAPVPSQLHLRSSSSLVSLEKYNQHLNQTVSSSQTLSSAGAKRLQELARKEVRRKTLNEEALLAEDMILRGIDSFKASNMAHSNSSANGSHTQPTNKPQQSPKAAVDLK